MSLQTLRRIYSVFFFALFVYFMVITDFRNMKGYEVSLFHEINPLVSIFTFFTSGTIYKGLIFSLLIIIPTLFLGRFFCSWICPMGILNQWVSVLYNKRKITESCIENSYRKIFRFKYYILLLFAVLAISGTLQIGLMDPIVFISRAFTVSLFPAVQNWSEFIYLKQPVFNGGIFISFLFLAVLFANRFITRFWCRVLCPLGALLGILSFGPLLRIRRNVERCTDCNKCLQHCQGGCDPHSKLRVNECHLCMNCIASCPEDALHYGPVRADSSVHQPFDINRRRLLETGVAAFILFPMMKSSLTGENKALADVIRPPGALPEQNFLNRCIKCSACMRVCPTNVLQPTLLESGFEGIWTPILLNKIGYCEYNCILCGQVCPTGAIKNISVEEKIGKKPFKNPVKIGTAFFDRGRCLPWAMNKTCIVCEEVCPTSPKAIWFRTKEIVTRDGKKKNLKLPYMDPGLCIGCGICENKCPVLDKPAIRVSSIGETRSKTNQMILTAGQ